MDVRVRRDQISGGINRVGLEVGFHDCWSREHVRQLNPRSRPTSMRILDNRFQEGVQDPQWTATTVVKGRDGGDRWTGALIFTARKMGSGLLCKLGVRDQLISSARNAWTRERSSRPETASRVPWDQPTRLLWDGAPSVLGAWACGVAMGTDTLVVGGVVLAFDATEVAGILQPAGCCVIPSGLVRPRRDLGHRRLN